MRRVEEKNETYVGSLSVLGKNLRDDSREGEDEVDELGVPELVRRGEDELFESCESWVGTTEDGVTVAGGEIKGRSGSRREMSATEGRKERERGGSSTDCSLFRPPLDVTFVEFRTRRKSTHPGITFPNLRCLQR